ncbi:phage portal protein [Rubellimicrobium aerolatum]|uniref:Phage portal protein n=1 Tax=Rubellimicrobium aerolatum TaxID=490979 RepID=A0ABW0SBI0_9RHOB|nr:phage portal protein [Rubellimicrobium aerolatum]MBP1805516.1 HK97 family phage portal protein [Rubellimicrobium aerolatum]
MFDFLRRKETGAPDRTLPVHAHATGSAPVPAAVTTAPTEAKASAAGNLIAWPGSSGRAALQPRDAAQLTQAGFARNPVGFRAVRLIAEAAAALPLVLQDAQSRYEAHPVLDLIARPNPSQGRAELLESLYGQLLLTGNGFVEAVAAEEGLPHELHVLRSDRMAVVPGDDGWPVAYDYTVGARRHRFPARAVCHVKSFHPQDDHYGLSALQAAAQAIEVHNGASRWSLALLQNAARPSGAIVYAGPNGGTMSQDQFDRLVSEMESQHQGARNAGRPMLLEGGLDWKPMGFSPSDMEFQQTKEQAAREIAIAFGVPPMILGLPGDATYANYQEANRAFYRLTVLPLATRVASAISDWLSDFTGERITLAPDLDQIPALATEREAQWRRVAQASFLSQAEKRRLLGLPPMEAADGT